MDKSFEPGIKITLVFQEVDVVILVKKVEQLADTAVSQHHLSLRTAHSPKFSINILTDKARMAYQCSKIIEETIDARNMLFFRKGIEKTVSLLYILQIIAVR